MKNLLLALAAIGLSAAVFGIGMASNGVVSASGITVEPQRQSYYCASVHFGMDDATLSGTATLTGGAIDLGAYEGAIGDASGVTMTGYSVATQAVYMLDGCGLKMSSSKKNSTITFSFSEAIVGCDVYAVGWKGDASYITINGDESGKVRVANDANITGTGSVGTVYEKYHFDFESTNDLVITASKRIVIGDIALRVA